MTARTLSNTSCQRNLSLMITLSSASLMVYCLLSPFSSTIHLCMALMWSFNTSCWDSRLWMFSHSSHPLSARRRTLSAVRNNLQRNKMACQDWLSTSSSRSIESESSGLRLYNTDLNHCSLPRRSRPWFLSEYFQLKSYRDCFLLFRLNKRINCRTNECVSGS